MTFNKYLFILIYLVLLGSIFGFTNENAEVENDLLNVNRAIYNKMEFYSTISYYAYTDYSSTQPYQTSHGIIYKQKDKQFSELMGIKSVNTKSSLIVVDSMNKVIYLNKSVDFEKILPDVSEFSKLLKICKNVYPVSGDKKIKGYHLDIKNGVFCKYDAVELLFDQKSYLINRIIYYYREEVPLDPAQKDSKLVKPKLELKFDFTNNHSSIANNIFIDSEYYYFKQGKYYPAVKYSGYRVINNKNS